MMAVNAVHFRRVSKEDLLRLEELHREAFPDAEFRRPYIRYRMEHVPELMIGCYHGDRLVGYVSGSRYHGDVTSDEAYCNHVPTGETVHLVELVVSTSYQRKGIGRQLVKSFVEVVKLDQTGVERIKLISVQRYLSFYTNAGFKVLGPSSLTYENLAWFDLEMEF